MSNIQRTPHGFDWSCAKIECLASDEKKGWIYLGVTTPKDSIEIYKSASTLRAALLTEGRQAMLTHRITKAGKMRVYNAKDSTNKKEML